MPKKKKTLVVLLPEVMDFHLDDDDRLENKIQKSIMNYLRGVPHSNFAKIQARLFVPWLIPGKY
jgi:hypothetical protein